MKPCPPGRLIKDWRIFADTIHRIWIFPGNAKRRVRAIARYAAWQVWERTVRRPWTVELTGNLKIRCYPHSPIASAVLYYGLADPMEMHFLMDFLQPQDHFIDVGANVGVYALLATSVPGVRVLAMEPSSLAYRRAEENIELNRLQDRVTLVREAAGKARATGYITMGLDAMNSLLEEGADGPAERVPVNTLDLVCSEHKLDRVTVIKVDVEGWETDVLEGALDLVYSRGPALIVEVNDPEGLETLRKRFGYECVSYLPAQRALVRTNLGVFKGRNAILVKDFEAAESRLGRSDLRPAGDD